MTFLKSTRSAPSTPPWSTLVMFTTQKERSAYGNKATAVVMLSGGRILARSSLSGAEARTTSRPVITALDSRAVSTYFAASELSSSTFVLATNLETPPPIPKSAIRPTDVVASTTDQTPTAATPIVSSR